MARSRATRKWSTRINVRRWRALLRAPAFVAILLLFTGCSSGGQQVVFKQTGGFTYRFPAQTDEVIDLGMTWGYLRNTSGQPVHVLSVTFAPTPASLHMLDVLAYSWADLHNIGLYSEEGVLAMECPDEFKPHPLSVVTVPPNGDAAWLVVIAFTISKPGIYQLNQVRVDYETQGHQGWQYQNMNTTITVKNPPLPGPTPLPRSSLCYSANVPPP